MSFAEFKELLRAYIGDRTDDETLALLEALDSLETPTNDNESTIADLKASLEAMTSARDELEREWRERYRNRFFGAGEEEAQEEDEQEEEEESEPMTASEAGKLWLEENGKHFR